MTYGGNVTTVGGEGSQALAELGRFLMQKHMHDQTIAAQQAQLDLDKQRFKLQQDQQTSALSQQAFTNAPIQSGREIAMQQMLQQVHQAMSMGAQVAGGGTPQGPPIAQPTQAGQQYNQYATNPKTSLQNAQAQAPASLAESNQQSANKTLADPSASDEQIYQAIQDAGFSGKPEADLVLRQRMAKKAIQAQNDMFNEAVKKLSPDMAAKVTAYRNITGGLGGSGSEGANAGEATGGPASNRVKDVIADNLKIPYSKLQQINMDMQVSSAERNRAEAADFRSKVKERQDTEVGGQATAAFLGIPYFPGMKYGPALDAYIGSTDPNKLYNQLIVAQAGRASANGTVPPLSQVAKDTYDVVKKRYPNWNEDPLKVSQRTFDLSKVGGGIQTALQNLSPTELPAIKGAFMKSVIKDYPSLTPKDVSDLWDEAVSRQDEQLKQGVTNVLANPAHTSGPQPVSPGMYPAQGFQPGGMSKREGVTNYNTQ